ncbi:MAG: dihydrodipicolinate reductase [Verrucomicrobia bacterium]|nr:MAG: dihydrodipicolinate reductase [Verrucomicrobiota bacterium]
MKIAQFGLGPIGLETLKLAASKPWADSVGAIDIDPHKIGKDLSHLTGHRSLRRRLVYPSIDDLLKHAKPDLIFHTAVSKFHAAFDQIEPIVRRGINVVSSCEELLFPQFRDPRLAARLDKICRRSGARVVGTGVNPGFVMDLLPICLTSVCRDVRSITVHRVVDASTRREPLQRKIGSGLAPQEFLRRFRKGTIGHAGLRDSLALIGHCLGWRLDKISETGEPVVAKCHIRTQFLVVVKRGQACGLHQRAIGRENGRVRLTLDLKMYLDAPDPHDRVQIQGDPPLDVLIRGGVAGDQATSAALVNAAPQLLLAPPGLRLITELPAGHFA